MKFYTNTDIRELNPCEDNDPSIYNSDENRKFTMIDILNHKDISDENKIWGIVRLLPEKESRLFAVWCAREALKLVENPDPGSIEACNVAERFAKGEATLEELRVARNAAYRAAWDAAASGAEDAEREKQIQKLKEMIIGRAA